MIAKPKLALLSLASFLGMRIVESPDDSNEDAPKHHFWILVLLALLCLFPPFAEGQTPVALLPPSHQQFFLPNGQPNAGGCVFFSQSGTSTLQATYTDISGTRLNTNPVILDSTGSATIYVLNSEYRVTMWSQGGTKCSAGTQLWSQDGVSAFQVVNGTQTIIFAGVTSDPVGQPGEVDYRTDLGQLRLFTTAWDSIATLNAVEAFTNKSIDVTTNTLHCTPETGGDYLRDNGTQIVCTPIQSGDIPAIADTQTIANSYTNDGTTGTVLNSLAKQTTNAFATVITPTTSDTGGVLGICISNCGTSGNASIAIQSSDVTCNFDGTPTVAGDYVTISATNAGNCHDAGASYPTGQQVLGRVLNTSASTMTLFAPEVRNAGAFPGIVYNTPSAALNSNSGAITMLTPAASASFRFSWYAELVTLGASCVGSSEIETSLTYQDPLAATATTVTSGPTNLFLTANPPGYNGVLGPAYNFTGTGGGFNMAAFTFRALAGTQIQYSVSYTLGTSCSPGPQYQIFPYLEQLTAN